jgi:hypothetical protein
VPAAAVKYLTINNSVVQIKQDPCRSQELLQAKGIQNRSCETLAQVALATIAEGATKAALCVLDA